MFHAVVLPPEVLDVIEAREVQWSAHAAESADRLALAWEDVIAIARSAVSWKRETDERGKAVDGWKDSVTGKDSRGRSMYMTGKRMRDGEDLYWYVVTIHESSR